MSYRLLKILTLSSGFIFSLGCTSTSPSSASALSPTTIVTPLEISEWETHLPASQGAVKITFTLPQQSSAEFQLFNGASRHIGYAVARVTLHDENCTSGHLVAINYKKSNSDHHITYFEKEASWTDTNTLILNWNANNQITTTLNGEVIGTDVHNHVTTLRIVSRFLPIKIQALEYLPM